MKNKLLIGSLSAMLLLAACGHDEDNGGPGKIKEGKKGADNKTEQKDNKDKSNSHKENKSEKDKDPKLSSDGKSLEKDTEYSKERPKEYNGSLVNTKNNAKNLPKNLQKDLDIKEGLVNYSDLKGKKGINDLIEKNTIQHPNKIANKEIHDKVWKILDKNYNQNTLKFSKKTEKQTGINTKKLDEQKQLIEDNYYGEDENVDYMLKAGFNGWKMDKKSLKVTKYNDDNTYQFEVNMVDNKGKQMAVVTGEVYDIIDQIVIDAFYGSDEGLHQAAIKDSKVKQGTPQPNKYK